MATRLKNTGAELAAVFSATRALWQVPVLVDGDEKGKPRSGLSGITLMLSCIIARWQFTLLRLVRDI